MAITAALVGLLAVIGSAEAAAVPARRGFFSADPTIQAASSDLSYTYAGCYFDPVGSVLSGLNVFDTAQMTPDKCIAACKSNGFDTAALTTPLLSPSRCWCAPANFFNLNKVSDSGCTSACSGASNLACGGALTNILVYKKDIARYSSVSNAAYSTSSSLAAYSASTSSSLAAYSASTSAVGYSKTSSLNAYSASTSAAAYSQSTASVQSSLNAYSSSTSAAAYSKSSSLNAYSASTSAAAQASLNAYSASQSAAAYSQSTAAAQASLNAYSASQSAAAYSQSTAAAQASLNAYSASQSAAAYSQSTAAAQASLNAYSASQSAAAYSQSTSLAGYSASVSAAGAAQSAAAQASLIAYSASQSAAAYSQSSSLAGYSASVSAAGAAQSAAAQSASAFSASVSAASASASAASASAASASASAAAAASTQLPSGWTKSAVCVAEGTNGRALTGDFTSGSMTFSKCVNYCSSKGFKLAGVEYGNECFCGNALTNGAALSKTSQNCNMACGGDSNSICGGSNAINLFTSDVSGLNSDLNQIATTPVVPVPAALPNGWAVASSSCIAEGTTGRAFDSATITGNDMTIDKCLSHCSDNGFSYAGLEYAGECRCGNALSNGASLSKTSTQCTMACSGDSTSICGGPNAISLYYNAGLAATPSASPSAAPSPSAAAPSLPAGWSVGSSSCIQEVSGRALTGARMDDPKMTPGKCATFCSTQGFKYAGVEYATECYCGDSLVNGASTSLVSGQCNMACGGDASLTCGGPNAIQLFYNPSVVAPAPSSTSPSVAPPAPTAPASISGLANRGCIQEVQGRALTGDSKASDDMTLEQCGAYCTGKGFSMFGVEYGRECYCGNQFSNGASASTLSGQCNMPCAGNSAEVCGGPNAINLYSA